MAQVGFPIEHHWPCARAHCCLGVAADISHINTESTVTGYSPGASSLKEALTGAEIVLIPAGVPRKPGMTRDGEIVKAKAFERAFSLTVGQIYSTPTLQS